MTVRVMDGRRSCVTLRSRKPVRRRARRARGAAMTGVEDVRPSYRRQPGLRPRAAPVRSRGGTNWTRHAKPLALSGDFRHPTGCIGARSLYVLRARLVRCLLPSSVSGRSGSVPCRGGARPHFPRRKARADAYARVRRPKSAASARANPAAERVSERRNTPQVSAPRSRCLSTGEGFRPAGSGRARPRRAARRSTPRPSGARRSPARAAAR
jgi:hypothetical protein